jgi:hypothetical protein
MEPTRSLSICIAPFCEPIEVSMTRRPVFLIADQLCLYVHHIFSFVCLVFILIVRGTRFAQTVATPIATGRPLAGFG